MAGKPKWVTSWAIAMALVGQAVAQQLPDTLKAEPGEISYQPGEGVSGSFVLVEDPAGLWSTGRGGACLVADLSASLGQTPCVVQDDCKEYHDEFRSRLPAEHDAKGSHAYCLQPADAAEPKRCWIRPGAQSDYCVVSPAHPLALNKPIRLPQAPAQGVPAFPLADGKPVRWMVNTCLNGFDFSQPNARRDRLGCKGEHPKSLETRTGRATTLNPPKD